MVVCKIFINQFLMYYLPIVGIIKTVNVSFPVIATVPYQASVLWKIRLDQCVSAPIPHCSLARIASSAKVFKLRKPWKKV